MSDEAGSPELLRFEARRLSSPNWCSAWFVATVTASPMLSFAKLASRTPASWEIPLGKEATESLIAELAAIRLPAIPESAIGVDGTTYSLSTKRGFNQVSLILWGPPPDACESIRPLLNA